MAETDNESNEKRRKKVRFSKEDDWSQFTHKWLTVSEVRDLEEKTGITVKRGRYSQNETERIKQIADDYLREKGMSETDIFEIVQRLGKKSNDLFVHIATTLNNGRTVLAIYNKVRRIYFPGNEERATWNPELDAELKRLVAINGPHWEDIGEAMDLFPTKCRDRYRLIRLDYNRGPWSEEETDQLSEIVLRLKSNHHVGPFWVIVSEELKTRNATQCLLKWVEHIEFHSKNSSRRTPLTWTPFEDYKLVSELYDLGAEDESEISWSYLVTYRDPFTGRHTQIEKGSRPPLGHWSPSRLSCRWRQLKKRVQGHSSLDMDSILEELLRRLLPKSQTWISNNPDGLSNVNDSNPS